MTISCRDRDFRRDDGGPAACALSMKARSFTAVCIIPRDDAGQAPAGQRAQCSLRRDACDGCSGEHSPGDNRDDAAPV